MILLSLILCWEIPMNVNASLDFVTGRLSVGSVARIRQSDKCCKYCKCCKYEISVLLSILLAINTQRLCKQICRPSKLLLSSAPLANWRVRPTGETELGPTSLITFFEYDANTCVYVVESIGVTPLKYVANRSAKLDTLSCFDQAI